MAPIVDIPLALVKSAAITGIILVWSNFKVKAFKMAWNIISTSPGEETLPKNHLVRCENCELHFYGDDNSRRWVLCQAVHVCDDCAKKEVVCEECQKHFLDDGEELEHKKFLCKTCNDREQEDFGTTTN